ncbi:hypothetical protein [Metabacillus niabensis]|uniref:hypothetical protein n=1 Tax=Metabacillus niabensis TaxID=324854 RepID=UPI001CFB326C|nr:hypothetical protein [Metabacillus niabensis]
MQPTQSILSTWDKFQDFPMETLTKVWYNAKGLDKKQRDVSLMREHRHEYGITGNCFDLALWLLDEFKRDGVEAYPIGHDINSEHAHVAVIAVNEHGNRYFCDLGDQWLCPILIDTNSQDYTNEKVEGFFPAAKVQVQEKYHHLQIHYHRPNGKVSSQMFQTVPIDIPSFLKAAEYCQNLIHPNPLLECRIPLKSETAHWEFYNWESFLSTTEGLEEEPKLTGIEEWVEKIHQKTGYHKGFLFDALNRYRDIQSKL